MEWAMAVAASAHAGQKDKGGRPYFLHVAGAASRGVIAAIKHYPKAGPKMLQDVFIGGLLHDVVEDTHHTLDGLLAHGIKQRHVEIVDLLTRREGQTYRDYLSRLISGGGYGRYIALVSVFVKMGDALDHIAPERAVPDWPDYRSIMKRDHETLARLTSAAWDLTREWLPLETEE